MPTEDPPVTHVERPVRFHTSLKELKAFLKRRPTIRGSSIPSLSRVTVGRYAGDETSIPTGLVSHYAATRALEVMTQIARNEPSSVTQVFVRKYYNDSSGPGDTLRVLVEAMPLSLAEREDINALKE